MKEITLSDLSSAIYSYAICNLPSDDVYKVLVVAFSGEAGNSHAHCGTFRFMDAVMMAGLIAWRPFGIVLDLRDLKYEWGDEMAGTLSVGTQWYREPYPTAVVVSDLNREGLTSLVKDELMEEPLDWLFESVDDAVKAIDLQGVSFLEEMRRIRKQSREAAENAMPAEESSLVRQLLEEARCAENESAPSEDGDSPGLPNE